MSLKQITPYTPPVEQQPIVQQPIVQQPIVQQEIQPVVQQVQQQVQEQVQQQQAIQQPQVIIQEQEQAIQQQQQQQVVQQPQIVELSKLESAPGSLSSFDHPPYEPPQIYKSNANLNTLPEQQQQQPQPQPVVQQPTKQQSFNTMGFSNQITPIVTTATVTAVAVDQQQQQQQQQVQVPVPQQQQQQQQQEIVASAPIIPSPQNQQQVIPSPPQMSLYNPQVLDTNANANANVNVNANVNANPMTAAAAVTAFTAATAVTAASTSNSAASVVPFSNNIVTSKTNNPNSMDFLSGLNGITIKRSNPPAPPLKCTCCCWTFSAEKLLCCCHDCCKSCCSVEAQHEYKVSSSDKKDSYFWNAYETSSGCERYCFPTLHSYTINVSEIGSSSNNGSNLLMTMSRPFQCCTGCWCCEFCNQQVDVHDVQRQELIGYTRIPCYYRDPCFMACCRCCSYGPDCLHKHVEIYSGHNTLLYTIDLDKHVGGNFAPIYKTDQNGSKIEINKTIRLTDKSTDFPEDATPSQRSLFLATLFLLEYNNRTLCFECCKIE